MVRRTPRFLVVQPKVFKEYGEQIRELVEKLADKDDDHTFEYIMWHINNPNDGTWWLIDKGRAMAYTFIARRPNKRVLYIQWIVGTDGVRWFKPFIKHLVEVAEINQCEVIEAVARLGINRRFFRAIHDICVEHSLKQKKYEVIRLEPL